MAPAGAPPTVLAALHRAAIEALPTREPERAMRNASAEPGGTSPDEFRAFVHGEIARHRALAERTQISMD
jgi:tripartite-type tricarboxylate transporter receptor subunit TctC